MKIKLDENLPERLAAELQLPGHNVDTVRAEHLTGSEDNKIWQADPDFSGVRRFAPGTHAGLPVVRLAQPGRDALVLLNCGQAA